MVRRFQDQFCLQPNVDTRINITKEELELAEKYVRKNLHSLSFDAYDALDSAEKFGLGLQSSK